MLQDHATNEHWLCSSFPTWSSLPIPAFIFLFWTTRVLVHVPGAEARELGVVVMTRTWDLDVLVTSSVGSTGGTKREDR